MADQCRGGRVDWYGVTHTPGTVHYPAQSHGFPPLLEEVKVRREGVIEEEREEEREEGGEEEREEGGEEEREGGREEEERGK